jgi:hypothetical protein
MQSIVLEVDSKVLSMLRKKVFLTVERPELTGM